MFVLKLSKLFTKQRKKCISGKSIIFLLFSDTPRRQRWWITARERYTS